MPAPSSPSVRIVAIWFLFLVTAAGVVGMYALHAVMPFNPIELPGQRREHTLVVFPEGWSFFTRNPREDRMLPYLPGANGRWESALRSRLGEPQNLFGASRAPGGTMLEAGLLAGQLVGREWTSCQQSVDECLSSAPVGREIANPTPGATLCGTVAFTAQPPVPWAWSRSPRVQEIQMPTRVVKVRVRC